MRKLVSLLSIIVSSLYCHAQLTFPWVYQLWGTGYEKVNGHCITADRLGNAYFTATFNGSLTSPPQNINATGGEDIVVVKYDTSGIVKWLKGFGGGSNDKGESIAVDTHGNVYLMGTFSGNTFGSLSFSSTNSYFLAKLDTAGNPVWINSVSGSVAGSDIETDTFGHVYFTGNFTGTASFGSISVTASPAGDMFLAQYNSAGVVQWVRTANGGSTGIAVATRPGGGVYVTGTMSANSSFSGLPVSGQRFVVKYDQSGNVQWGTGFVSGNTPNNSITTKDMTVDTAGNCYLTGWYTGAQTFNGNALPSGPANCFVFKFDNTGTPQWASCSTNSGLRSESICLDNAGNIIITGELASVGSFPGSAIQIVSQAWYFDRFVAKFDNSGTLMGAISLANSSPAMFSSFEGSQVATNPNGGVYIAGNFEGTITLGTYSVSTASGNRDLFIGRINNCTAPPGPMTPAIWPNLACIGQQNIFSAWILPEAANYAWTLPPGWSGRAWNTFGTSRMTATATATGGTITVTPSNLCGIGPTLSTSVTTATPPIVNIAAAGSTLICSGNTVTLNATATPGVGYQWRFQTSAVPGATNSNYTAGQQGVYDVIVTNGTCSDTSNTISVTLDLVPTPFVSAFGNFLTTPAGQGTYQWYHNGTAIPGATSFNYTAPQSGSYHVIVTNSNGCWAQSNTVGLTVGIEDITAKKIIVYPQPNNGIFRIELPDGLQPQTIRITDVKGVIVDAKSSFTGDKTTVDLGDAASGIYFLQMAAGNHVYRTRFEIQR